MGGGPRSLCRALAILVVALLLPGGAALADTTINFDDLAAGTSVTNQYAGQGVVFGPLPGGAGDSPSRPVVKNVGAQAQSLPNVADIWCSSCNEGLGSVPEATGTFTTQRSHVAVYVGYLGSPAATCAPGSTASTCAVVTLLAFDSGGKQIAASSPATVTQGAGVHTLLSVSTASALITGFEVVARSPTDDFADIAIDDLSFDTPTTSTPDFTLSTSSTQLNVVQGASASAAITIGRLGGSAGDVGFSVSGLPSGVTAQFAPNPASGGSTTLTLTADPTAPATLGAFPSITITGTPQATSAGSTAHTLPLTVGVLAAFDVHAAPATVSLSSCSASVTVDVSRDPSFAGPVSLSVTGLPSGVQASFNPAQITFPGSATAQTSTLTLTAPATGLPAIRRTATIHASAPPFAGRTATFSVGGTCPQVFQARITSMQITQGTQLPFLPTRDPNFPGSPIPYSTIEHAAQPGTQQAAAHLRARRWTVVRVYADLGFGPSDGLAVPMVLHGFIFNGIGQRVELPGSPITPTYSPSRLYLGPDQATTSDEGSDTAAYEFTLPSSWVEDGLEVIATLLPAQSSQSRPVAIAAAHAAQVGPFQQPVYAPCTTGDCTIGYSFGIRDIPFYEAAPLLIEPVALTANSDTSFPDVPTAFGWARNESPVSLYIEPYAATIDVSDLVGKSPSTIQNATSDRTQDYDCNANYPPGLPWVVGVTHNMLQSYSRVKYGWCWGPFPSIGHTDKFAVVDSSFPAYSVAHELFHLMGRGHASAACGGAHDDSLLQLAIPNHEDWPPDQVGYIQSVGLAPQSLFGNAPYHVIMGGPPASPEQSCPGGTPPCPTSANTTDWFDLMSYCGSRLDFLPPLQSNVWVSVHNWNGVLDNFKLAADRGSRSSREPSNTPRVTRAGPPGVPSLYVRGILSPSGTVTITSTMPVTAAPQSPAGTGYRLAAIDSSGRVRANVSMLDTYAHVDGQPPEYGIAGVIPTSGVQSIEVMHNGAVLARHDRPAHAPTVTLPSLPRFRGATALVRWRAQETGASALTTQISFSGDGGRTWRLVWVGPNRESVALPARYLFRSARARIRVAVDDGFQQAVAVSRRFRSAGAAPSVSILLPARGFHQPNDAPLLLSGQAFDDRLRLLTGRHLRWMLGRRVLGTGSQVTVTGLPAGRQRIDLIAIDSAGRQARASLHVGLRAARPLFLALATRARVGRGARTLRLTVESSLAATLTIRTAGLKPQRFKVGTRTSHLRVRFRPGRGLLKLQMSLSASGLSRTVIVTVRRA
jgi:hypothetical protein